MNKKIKVTILGAAVIAAGLGSWRTYDAYKVNESSLIVENVEAISKPGEGWEDLMDEAFGFLQKGAEVMGNIGNDILNALDDISNPDIALNNSLANIACKTSEKGGFQKITSKSSVGVSVSGGGDVITVGTRNKYSYEHNEPSVKYTGKEENVCTFSFGSRCDRTQQVDCNGVYYYHSRR